jgi:hypothetical protein
MPPTRLVSVDADLGIVMFPVPSEIVADPHFDELRTQGLKNLTLAHKYDQRCSKCVGLSFAKDGTDFLIDWCLIEYPWKHEAELEHFLAGHKPFEVVRSATVDRFKFR